MIALIGAFSRLHAIYGTTADIMPFRSKTDMAFFVTTTTGSTVIMGRSTWESLPIQFRPLVGRQNIVVTSDTAYELPEGVLQASSLAEAIKLADRENIFLIGGKRIWQEGLAIADTLYITEIGWEPTTGSDMSQYLMFPELIRTDCLIREGFDKPEINTRIDESISGGVGTLTFLTYKRTTTR
jgi:dihydrofolate reductase